MSDYPPEEVWIHNILSTLPIKTLLRCTSVCKSWYSLITSPSFISTHLNRNKQQDPPLLLLSHCSEHPRKEHFSIHHDNPTLDDYAELDFPFHSVNWYFRIVGSCNGVVCLSDDDRVTYVEDDDGFDIVPPEVELYSLSRGCWQSISDCGVQSIIPERSPQVYISGAVHWIAYDRKTMAVSLVESWTKLFAIIDYQESLGPVIGFTKNSEVLLGCGYDGSSSSRLGSRERREWENVRSGGIVILCSKYYFTIYIYDDVIVTAICFLGG
ncbi:hypothetical protein ACSBR2_027266 [Camellia fascicularis]